MSDVIAVLCADLHLCHTPPVARSSEPDWYGAMDRYLKQLRDLVADHNCPVLCAGDIFDRWDANPELINWAIEHLPESMFAIPGQHDQPEHSIEMMHRSAYRTLCEAGVVQNVNCKAREVVPGVLVYSFRWGEEVQPVEVYLPDGKPEGYLHLALIHDYIWTAGHKHSKSREESLWSNWSTRLEGYDVAVFGDNHSGFIAELNGCRIINCGCLYPRRSDQINYTPKVGLLYEDGSITRVALDTVIDSWLVDDPILADGHRATRLLEELSDMVDDSLDFREAVMRGLDESPISPRSKQIVRSIMEKHHGK